MQTSIPTLPSSTSLKLASKSATKLKMQGQVQTVFDPAAHPQAGLIQLYLPNLLFGPSQDPLPNNAFPNYSGHYDQPPFALARIPAAFRNIHGIERLKFIALKEAPEGLSGGITQTASSIMNMPENDRLRRIRRCRTMWDNARDYARPASPNNTWTGTSRASLRDQALAISSLSAWYIDHTAQTMRGYIPVNGHEAIGDQIKKQILQPLEYLLHTRYRHLKLPGVHVEGRYPLWGRPSRKHHSDPGPDAAGYPDFSLYGEAGRQPSCHLEVKSWAAYHSHVFDALYSSQLSMYGTGDFAWGGAGMASRTRKLVRQIWGQLHFFRAWFGICINGRDLFIYVKNNDGELIVSPLEQWNKPGLLEMLFGFCCASIDDQLAGNSLVLVGQLAPPTERESNWTA